MQKRANSVSPSLAVAFADIARNRGCSTANLRGQTKSFFAWKRGGDVVERQGQLVSLLPHL